MVECFRKLRKVCLSRFELQRSVVSLVCLVLQSIVPSLFSVRTGTSIEKSRLPLRKWVFAIYLYVTNLKGVSSMKLHSDLKVTQKTAWFMLHRLREAWGESGLEQFVGPVEADETYMGGKRSNRAYPFVTYAH